ncbi:hypothetical protein GH714_007106 [Hevea brasiliensis]|uniref:Leucine-rich repeat-containing N-terminal plant-type domain-containing protein n=1 Tax=Hevea brasiliensis TaxID=3981 RepID=A0A6A6LZ24_HEVBR|nr:hypothetical protein GH714_007106 [Hevea brasiliensis]
MSFKNLKDLKFLDLSRNALAGLLPPGIVENLSSLKLLSVHSNKLEAMAVYEKATEHWGNEAFAYSESENCGSYGEHLCFFLKGGELEYTSTLHFLGSIDF